MELTFNHISALLMAFIGLIEDLRLRKVRNKVLLPLLLLAFGLVLFETLSLAANVREPASSGTGVFAPLINSIFSFSLAAALFLPLYFFKVLGAGDVKLALVVSLLLTPAHIPLFWFSSLFWGAVLGLILIGLQKNWQVFILNFSSIYFMKQASQDSPHRTPFTFALLLGLVATLNWRGSWL